MASLAWRLCYPLGKTKAVVVISFVWIIIVSLFFVRNYDHSFRYKDTKSTGVQNDKIIPKNDYSLLWINFKNVAPNNGTTRSSPVSAQKPRATASEAEQEPVKSCVHPKLLENDPVMMRFFKKLPIPQCVDEEWLFVENGTVRFSKSALQKYKNFTCDYYPLTRVGDYNFTYSDPIKNISDGFRMISDFFKGVCTSEKKLTNRGIYSGIYYSDDRAKRSENADPLNDGFQGMNIAILGFDSMSRMSWHRRLKETRSYFKDTLGAIELESHNIVGDGTTAVMFPMLTGKFEWELPECR
ncbi:hypothetical protein PoB_002158300 [Plakobranchus ocellatus]|uniref:Methyltransferase domain-containing protein n=1 Tax=Plakobranchus ocellatus TaxID=259542 RepID=A0AAV3ZKQ1_9GAST|nr:hypothetical protein PoB_002158300 [Plakobranchus ocellatus]